MRTRLLEFVVPVATVAFLVAACPTCCVNSHPPTAAPQPAPDVLRPTPVAHQADVIYFDFDKADIGRDEEPTLLRVRDSLTSSLTQRLTIVGYADERGGFQYNLDLGCRRAEAAKRYLVSNGVSPTVITVQSGGEGYKTCDEHVEGCWRKNRRAEFHVTLAIEYSRCSWRSALNRGE